ncbi:hypothetical protein WJX81_005648 [Elliptochloris bilobata]|uniref:Uncharacterized protein n=1 Tax=Elliptochloris bilobata TaxID=381761 RepID=A0AAW1QWE9_9CHLO
MQWEADAAAKAGVTLSLLRFAIAFFTSVLVGALYPHVPSVKGKHIYNLVTGFALLYYVFGSSTLLLLVPAVLTYIIMLGVRESCATLVWLLVFGIMVACHVLNQSGDTWRLGEVDFTGAMMVATLKLISTAVCYQDGLASPEELKPYQRAHRLERLPSPLEGLSYLFAGGNLLAGPHFELSDYLAFVERRGAWDPSAPRPPPSGAWVGIVRMAKAVACLGIYLWLGQLLPPAVVQGAWYASASIPLRAVTMWAAVVIYRFKYYFAWSVSEAALIFSGFCYNGLDSAGRARWDRFANTRIRRVEFSTNPAELPAHWNTCTGNWLRQYVYERLTPKGKKPSFKTLLSTQLVAGVWHGLFPGYALFFASSAFLFESGKVIYRYERSLPPRYAWLARWPPWLAVKWAFTALVLNYMAISFLLLDFWPSIRAWADVNLLGHILVLSILLVAKAMPPRRPRLPAPAAPDAGAKSEPSSAGLIDGADSRGAAAAGAVAGVATVPTENGAAKHTGADAKQDTCPAPASDGGKKTL